MQIAFLMRMRTFGSFVIVAILAILVTDAQHRRNQTLAPHEFMNNKDAPPAILWETPALPGRSQNFESAEERRLRLVVVAEGLQQPWSIAFLPDGDILVTERAGRLRLVHHGKLQHDPVAGVPPVQTGGPRGL